MAKGVICNKVISAVDIYPTVMELCGVNMPHKTDGKSFAKLLQKPKSKHWKNVAYSYFNNGITVRTDRYRFTKYFRGNKPDLELYDHTTDPFENNNVASERPEIVNRIMRTWKKGDTGLYDKNN